MVYTPEHEVPAPSLSDTYTHEYARVSILVFKFECRPIYFLFVRVGSYCAHAGMEKDGTVPRLVTLVCEASKPAT